MDLAKQATDFLRTAAKATHARELEAFFAAGARHHNPHFPAGVDALVEAMVQSARQAPHKLLEVKHVIAHADMVAVHSHVRQEPADRGGAVVHIFRFEGDRIAELWDVGQAVPGDCVNEDGMF